MKKLLGAFLALIASASFGATLSPIQLLNPTGSSSGQAIVSTGASSAPAWGGVGLNGIAAIAANTVLANATGSSAAPTAFAMPSCSTSASALNWTTSSGFTCNTSINAALLSGNGIGTSGSTIPLLNGTNTWSGGQTFSVVITPSAGITGTTNGSVPGAGKVGQPITAQVLQGSAVSLTTATPANVTSISLTAGDWDVWGSITFTTGGTTVVTGLDAGINTTSASLGTFGQNYAYWNGSFPTGNAGTLAPPQQIITVSTTTTVYLVAQAAFTTSTCSAFGFIIARRRD